jgi:hypothetical protein
VLVSVEMDPIKVIQKHRIITSSSSSSSNSIDIISATPDDEIGTNKQISLCKNKEKVLLLNSPNDDSLLTCNCNVCLNQTIINKKKSIIPNNVVNNVNINSDNSDIQATSDLIDIAYAISMLIIEGRSSDQLDEANQASSREAETTNYKTLNEQPVTKKPKTMIVKEGVHAKLNIDQLKSKIFGFNSKINYNKQTLLSSLYSLHLCSNQNKEVRIFLLFKYFYYIFAL